MTDKFSPFERSRIMSQIKNKNTKPEKAVRSILHKMGYRFRINVNELPGNPDIVLPKYRRVIFVHGCFWHGHKGCKRAKRPSSNKEFWNKKIDSNIERDKKVRRELRKIGWGSLVVWQCQLKKPELLIKRLNKYLVFSEE
ncbi:MAG TPA: very short patch repair endonuclease [bacterium]|nr:very short patch repair endonuclease [bacterium]